MFRIGGFTFYPPGELRDGDLQLVLRETAAPSGGWVPAYRFDMVRLPEGVKAGRIELRVGFTPDIVTYTGNIGYRVEPAFRGHRYAARACRLLIDLARKHGLPELWITCDPDNLASRRSIELTGAEYVSTVPVPEDHSFYKSGSRAKDRFRLRTGA
jgi:predicted acetyltransferase